MKRFLFAVAVAALAAACQPASAPSSNTTTATATTTAEAARDISSAVSADAPYITAAIADTHRPAADRAQDAARHPAETLALSGVAPGQKIAELLPGEGYFTRLFSNVVGAQGRVYAISRSAHDQYEHVVSKARQTSPMSFSPMTALQCRRPSISCSRRATTTTSRSTNIRWATHLPWTALRLPRSGPAGFT